MLILMSRRPVYMCFTAMQGRLMTAVEHFLKLHNVNVDVEETCLHVFHSNAGPSYDCC